MLVKTIKVNFIHVDVAILISLVLSKVKNVNLNLLCQDPTTGTTRDWARFHENVKYAFIPELRGDSHIIDAEEIHPSFEEVWNGVVAMSDAIDAIEGQQ